MSPEKALGAEKCWGRLFIRAGSDRAGSDRAGSGRAGR